ncbi:MAG TPA: OB-fold domain-containing protein [Candidatus Binataceae bacterium]|nr:OB-fold domain-containing protein [Candidatus Binataceae bacterium]
MATEQSGSTYYLPELLPASPTPDGRDREFWEALKRHQIVVQRCNACGTLQMEPEWLCHKCLSFDRGWKEVAGKGRIYSWVRIWHPVPAKLKEICPFVVVLVELPDADNLRIAGNLLGDPQREVEIGAPVEAAFEDHKEKGYTLLQWRLVR